MKNGVIAVPAVFAMKATEPAAMLRTVVHNRGAGGLPERVLVGGVQIGSD